MLACAEEENSYCTPVLFITFIFIIISCIIMLWTRTLGSLIVSNWKIEVRNLKQNFSSSYIVWTMGKPELKQYNYQILTNNNYQILTNNNYQILTNNNYQILTNNNIQILTNNNYQILTNNNYQILTNNN